MTVFSMRGLLAVLLHLSLLNLGAEAAHDELLADDVLLDPAVPRYDAEPVRRPGVSHASGKSARSSRSERGQANASLANASFIEFINASAAALPRIYSRLSVVGALFLLAMVVSIVAFCLPRADTSETIASTESDLEESAHVTSAILAVWEGTEWLDQTAVNEVTPKERANVPVDILEPKWTVASLTQLLASQGTPPWEDNALQSMARELAQGKASLSLSGTELFRVIEMVVVLVVYEPEQLVLQVLSHPAHRREFSGLRERTIKARKRNQETLDEAVGRCLVDAFGSTDGIFSKWKLVHEYESHERYAHMPGLTCLVRKHVARCSVIASSPNDLKKVGLADKRLQLSDYVYAWSNIDELYNLRKYKNKLLHPDRMLQQQQGEYFIPQMLRQGPPSTLSVPLIPWSKPSVVELLKEHGFTFKSGAFGLKTMDDLVSSLQAGSLALGLRRDPAELVGVVDVVSVLIRSRNGMVLGTCATPRKLLTIRQLPNESVAAAASRLVRKKLSLSSDLCREDEEDRLDKLDTWEVSDSLLVEVGLPGASAQNIVGRGYTARWLLDANVKPRKHQDI